MSAQTTKPPFTLTASVIVEMDLEAVRARICKMGEGRAFEDLEALAKLHDALRKCISKVRKINPPAEAADWWKKL